MTLTIIDECTHNKTFSVYGKPNGAVNILEDAPHGFHLNPRVHANLPPFFISDSRSDGSKGTSSCTQASDLTSLSREVSVLEEESLDNFEEAE